MKAGPTLTQILDDAVEAGDLTHEEAADAWHDHQADERRDRDRDDD